MSQDGLFRGQVIVGYNRPNRTHRRAVEVISNGGVDDEGKSLIEVFDAANYPAYQLSRFRGTADAPLKVEVNDRLGSIEFDGSDGATGNSPNKARVTVFVDAATVVGQSPATRMHFDTGLNNAAQRTVAYLSSEGYFGLGTAFDPTVAATRAAYLLHVVQSGAGTSLDAHIAAYEAGNAAHLHLSRARGTFAVPTNVVAADNIGRFIGTAYSNGLLDTCEIRYTVDDAVVAGQRPASRISFWTNLANTAPARVGYFSREGYLGLGSAFAPDTAETRAAYDVHAAKNDTVGRLQIQAQGFGTSADGPYFAVAHPRGTFAAPANNADGDNMGDFEWYGYAGGYQQAAEIRAFVTGAVVNGVTPDTNMAFKVATAGAMSNRVLIFSTGRVGMGSGSRATETDAATNGEGALWVAENSNRTPISMQYSGTNGNAVQFSGRKSRGASLSAPTDVVSGDSICEFRAKSYSGGWQNGGYLEFVVDAAVVSGQAPATRIGLWVNANNASPVEAFRVRSDRTFIMGASMTQFTDAVFNYNLSGGAGQVVATYGQNGGSPNSMIFGYSTYSSGYTNGHPARMVIADVNFSCSFQWDVKLTGASSNALATALMIDPKANMPNVSFFSNAGSYGLGQGVIAIANRNTAPSLNPVGGGVLYAEGGALKWRGSAGTVTTIANA